MNRNAEAVYGLAILTASAAIAKFWSNAQERRRLEALRGYVRAVVPQSDQGIQYGAPGPQLIPAADLAPFIAEWEGYRPRPYRDSVGVWTVGYGFNIDVGADVLADLGTTPEAVISGQRQLTEEELNGLLLREVLHARQEAVRLHPDLVRHPLQIQQIVVDMVYNLGPAGFAAFTNARQALDAGDYARFADEIQDSRWYGQVGRRSRHHVDVARSVAGVSR